MSEAVPVRAASAPPPPSHNLVEVAAEIVGAYVARNSVPASELPALLATVHATLSDLGRATPSASVEAKPVPAVPVRKSVTDDHLISLEDGRRYKSLKRHLSKHGLTPEDYRAKWDLPSDYPMVAPAYARARSALAKSMGLGALRRKR